MLHLKYAHSFEVVRELPPSLHPLVRLAQNFHWTWHQETQTLFQETDRALWEELEHNPHQLLDSLSKDRIKRLSKDEAYLSKLKACEKELTAYLNSATWFHKTYPEAADRTKIAYFCAEFGLAECLPIYSGGLGVLAGDLLKAASDLGLPMVGVGLLYNRGYFKQFLSPDGWQQEHYTQYDFYEMPLQLVRGEDSQPIHIHIEFPDGVVTCQIWKAQVGRIPLYLLDSNVLENTPNDQSITDTLYGGDEEMRIRQEMVLGIGGMRALKALGICPTVCHMNEGYPAFLILERLWQFMHEHKCDLQTARQVIINGNVFTTHTPVPVGFDIFHRPLLERYLSKTLESIGMSVDTLLSLGRIDPVESSDIFNMAIFAMENSNYINAVSGLHSQVTRAMFHAHWSHFPQEEVPIQAIPNGVHIQSWIGVQMAQIFDRYLGTDWRHNPCDSEIWEAIHDIPDSELWEVREGMRGLFVRYCRRYLQKKRLMHTAKVPTTAEVSNIFDARILTIGFARRFATYKRATLLFSDKERLRDILFHPERPVQIVFAGKSHPRDEEGKRFIQEIVHFINYEGGQRRVLFLEDYNMGMAKNLIQGVDLWLNTPRRPYEASGTSGMKAVPNGVLNCSTPDGWWADAYHPGLGWIIGDGSEHPDQAYQDWLDSLALYQLLETEIAPTFYHRTENGVPVQWVQMVKRSIAELSPKYCTARVSQEYTRKFYMPAAHQYNELKSDNLKLAKDAYEWKIRMERDWPLVKIISVEDNGLPVSILGTSFNVKVVAGLGNILPEDVKVQVVIGHVGPNRELLNTAITDLNLMGTENGNYVFEGEVLCKVSGHRGYVVRIIPHSKIVNVPTELPLVTWESHEEAVEAEAA